MNTTLSTSRIAPNLEAARKLFAVPVFYKDNPQYDDAANHDNILRGPTMPSKPTAWSPGANAYAQNLYLPRVPLLTRDEEGGLFLRYNFYKRKLRLLQEQFNIAEPPDSTLIEFQRLDAAARADRSTLLEANLRLVVKLAMLYVLPQLTLEELTAEGSSHMLKVIDNFDVLRGFKFSTYATWALRRHFWKYRAKEARYLSRYRQSEVCEGAGGRAHHEPVGEEARCALLGEKLASIMGKCLTERERVVVRGRFGIGTSEAKTLAQLGEELKLSTERVRQLETLARSKLLRALSASPQIAALIPDHMVREFESARESRRKS
jgi:RNA polymerase primary sigma factor